MAVHALVAAGLIIAWVGMVAGASAGEETPPPPPPLRVVAHGEALAASAGSGCVMIDTLISYRAHYPLRLRGRLAVRPGARIELRPELPATRVSVAIVRRSSAAREVTAERRRARPVGGEGRVFRHRLPARLEGPVRLDLRVRFVDRRGYLNYQVGLAAGRR